MNPQLEHILSQVKKPARYTGGEWNSIRKDWDRTEIKTVFAFPDVYEVGMSHLGLHILYDIVNSRRDATMERVFAPWPDMAGQMRDNNLPLFALESQRPIKHFDIVAFTLQYEMSFSNILYMLDLAGIPLLSSQRNEGDPLVIAGGPCAFNPEPIADFIDLFVIGEGEDVINELLDLLLAGKQKKLKKNELLLKAVEIPGIYVPSFYEVSYGADGAFLGIRPAHPDVPERVTKRVVKDLDAAPFPLKPVVPITAAVHDRMMIEVFRGCTRGCRFCQAGIIYRPVREKKPETVLRQAAELVNNTGFDEVSLSSLSTSDYTPVLDVIKAITNEHAGRGVNVSLPSLRADQFSMELAREVQRVRRSSLTFAPEAGTQRLRDVINKGVTEDDLMGAAGAAFKEGWQAIKLYFMIGLPTETDDDVAGIARLAGEVLALGRKSGVPRKRLKVTVSVSSFIPKPHTVFQWEPQELLGSLRSKQDALSSQTRERGLVLNYHDANLSFIEAVFARGDRRLGNVLIKAFELGCRFDGWSEYFNIKLWLEAFRLAGIDPEAYAYRRFSYDDPLPWSHIDTGVSRQYLVLEHKRAMAGAVTPDCRSGNCPGCGLCPAFEIEPFYAGSDL
ncbi:MAG: TIGR03960 family B12-binding radical SAM protein [Desulfotomaculaceae bacterium]|nr:TIGR03960 family B12-binding radical SAM protein [Desulfotomaculaceae bacterium]